MNNHIGRCVAIVDRRSNVSKEQEEQADVNASIETLSKCRIELRDWALLTATLNKWYKLRGLYQYFGIRGNFISIHRMYKITIYAWFKWLNRRSKRHSYTWKVYGELLKYFKLPKPGIVHYNV